MSRAGLRRETRRVWTPPLIERLTDLYARGVSLDEIALRLSDEFGRTITPKAVETARYCYLPRGFERTISERASGEPPLLIAPHLPDGDYMVCSDVHLPFYSSLWLDRYLKTARAYRIRRQIIAGDLFDFHVFSHFPKLAKGGPVDLEDEFAVMREPVERLAQAFDITYLITGNHERRVSRLTDARLTFDTLFRIFGDRARSRFELSPFDRVFVGDKWLVVHPISYSQVSGAVAVRLAAKYHRHVINAHGHFVALRYDTSGEYVVCDSGGLMDWTRIDYASFRTTTHPCWNNGFVMLRNGRLHLFHAESEWKSKSPTKVDKKST